MLGRAPDSGQTSVSQLGGLPAAPAWAMLAAAGGMATTAGYERLSVQDSSFVLFEDPGTPMHVGAVAVFDAGPLALAGGGLDVDRLRRHVGRRLPRDGGYRQHVAQTPLQRHPIWVDDPGFDLDYHVRHVSLPRPGGEAQLKELTGRLLSQPLDRRKPLWEMWVVEGLSGNRFAIVAKLHHAMVDGIAGIGLVQALLSPSPELEAEDEPRFQPRPAPGLTQLLLDEARRALAAPGSALAALGQAAAQPREASARVAAGAEALWRTVQDALRLPPSTPLNQTIGSQRRIDWCAIDLAELQDLKKRLDGTVNDVVLSVVAGALRRFFKARRQKLAGLRFRVVVPVNMRVEEGAVAGNRVSALFLDLPVAERDPLRRFRLIRERMRWLKSEQVAQGVDLVHRFLDWSRLDWLAGLGSRVIYALRPYNMVVTNIPGPAFPLYLAGARLCALQPQVPLFRNQGLGIAALSYCGQVHFGLVADRDLVPDVHRFAEAIPEAFAELREATRRKERSQARRAAAGGSS